MKTNRTVQRATDILYYVAANPNGVSIDEICAEFELPKTSAYDILVTLVQERMLTVRNGVHQLYETGMGSYLIGMSYRNANDDISLIETSLQEIAVQMDRTAFFANLSGSSVMYLLKVLPANPIITTANVGTTAPLYCTSLGKTLLAWMPEDEAEALMDGIEFNARTSFTITNVEDLRKDLELIRSRGYAVDFREYEDHMLCVSAPIYDRQGRLIGAISTSGIFRADDDFESMGEYICSKAKEISRLLGYRG